MFETLDSFAYLLEPPSKGISYLRIEVLGFVLMFFSLRFSNPLPEKTFPSPNGQSDFRPLRSVLEEDQGWATFRECVEGYLLKGSAIQKQR